MRSVPFSEILFESLQLCGLDRTTLDLKTFGTIRDFCSNRISQIWNREQWSESVRWLESRWGGYTIVNATIVDGIVTITLDDAEIEEADMPAAGDTFEVNFPSGRWTGTSTDYSGSYEVFSVTAATRTIIFDLQTTGINATMSGNRYKGALAINGNYLVRLPATCDTVIGVYSADPRKTTRVRPVDFSLEEVEPDAIGFSTEDDFREYTYIRTKTIGPFWIQYKELPPRLYGDPYSATYTYTPLQQAYSGALIPSVITSAGFDFFIADEPTPGTAPAVSNSQWQKVPIPWRFKDYLVRGILADYLRSEGQFQQAALADAQAEIALQLALDTFLRQSQQSQKINMINLY